MMLLDIFCESAGHTRQDFLKSWGPLIDYLNRGADGVIASPYRLEARLDVEATTLDVALEVRLCRAHAIAGQSDPYWENLGLQYYRNLNLAGMLPFGDAFRFIFGRDKTMKGFPTGPMPLYTELKDQDPHNATAIQEWALNLIRTDLRAGRRPALRVIHGGHDQGPKV